MLRPIVLLVAITCWICEACKSTQAYQSDPKYTTPSNAIPPKRTDLTELHKRFQQFRRGDSASIFEVRLCADVPNDKNPSKVLYKKEPGHVFLIFYQVSNSTDTISHVFGYYPWRPASVILGKNIKSQIRNNNGRIYDVHISRKLSEDLFFAVLDSSLLLARKKYNLNRFNCYDYGLKLFNMTAPDHAIPLQYVKFPFIWGRGGSPVGLYRDLKKMKESGDFWAPYIQFGCLIAPK
jgi:hypothetical protein